MSSSSDSIQTRKADIELLRQQMSAELRQLSHEIRLLQWEMRRLADSVARGVPSARERSVGATLNFPGGSAIPLTPLIDVQGVLRAWTLDAGLLIAAWTAASLVVILVFMK
jgi:hypothetical protein